MRCRGYRDFAVLLSPNLGNNIIGLPAHGFRNLFAKLLIGAYFNEILHSEQHIFSAPEIPCVKLMIFGICAYPPLFLPNGQHVRNGFNKRFHKRFIASH